MVLSQTDFDHLGESCNFFGTEHDSYLFFTLNFSLKNWKGWYLVRVIISFLNYVCSPRDRQQEGPSCSFQEYLTSWLRWHVPVVPALVLWRETEVGDLQCKATLGYPKTNTWTTSQGFSTFVSVFSSLPSYIRKYNAVLSYKEKYIKQRENALVLSSSSFLSRVPCSLVGLGFSMYLEIALSWAHN